VVAVIQLFNAFMDFAVWFALNYYVPSWAMGVVIFVSAVLIYLLSKEVK
jgi:hypothetical protein